MLPPQTPSLGQRHPPSSTETQGEPASAEAGAVAAAAGGAGSGSSAGSSDTGAGAGAGAGSIKSAKGGAGVIEKAKVKSIKLMDRLQPSELWSVSLPFREATLRNGDVVAKRGTGIVLHTRVDGREGNLWLKCRSNQDRGALVDAIVPWFEANLPGARELDVQQVCVRGGGGYVACRHRSWCWCWYPCSALGAATAEDRGRDTGGRGGTDLLCYTCPWVVCQSITRVAGGEG